MVSVWCLGWLLARPGRGRCVQEEDVEDVAGCSWAQPRPAEAAQRLALRHSGAGRGGDAGRGAVWPPCTRPRPAPPASRNCMAETDDGDTVLRQDSCRI